MSSSKVLGSQPKFLNSLFKAKQDFHSISAEARWSVLEWWPTWLAVCWWWSARLMPTSETVLFCQRRLHKGVRVGGCVTRLCSPVGRQSHRRPIPKACRPRSSYHINAVSPEGFLDRCQPIKASTRSDRRGWLSSSTACALSSLLSISPAVACFVVRCQTVLGCTSTA